MELVISFLKIGALSFGGGYAMVPFIQQEVIVHHGWLSLERFLDVMAISAMTPGPVAINAATFIGYQVKGVLGSVSATTAVVLPSFVIMLIAGLLLKRYRNVSLVKRMFNGVRPAAFALIAVAAISTGTSLKYDVTTVIVGLTSFAIITFTKIHPILVLVAAGASGVILYLI